MKLPTTRHALPRMTPIEAALVSGISALILFLVAIPYSGAVASAIVIVPTAPVPSTDVGLTALAPAGPVQAGDLISYTLVTANIGPLEATNVTVSVDLPGGTRKPVITVISVGSAQGTCEAPDGQLKLKCHLGSISDGSDVGITIMAQVTDEAQNELKVSASVVASERDNDRQNNRVMASTLVQ